MNRGPAHSVALTARTQPFRLDLRLSSAVAPHCPAGRRGRSGSNDSIIVVWRQPPVKTESRARRASAEGLFLIPRHQTQLSHRNGPASRQKALPGCSARGCFREVERRLFCEKAWSAARTGASMSKVATLEVCPFSPSRFRPARSCSRLSCGQLPSRVGVLRAVAFSPKRESGITTRARISGKAARGGFRTRNRPDRSGSDWEAPY